MFKPGTMVIHKIYGLSTVMTTDTKLHPGLTENEIYIKPMTKLENHANVLLVDVEACSGVEHGEN